MSDFPAALVSGMRSEGVVRLKTPDGWEIDLAPAALRLPDGAAARAEPDQTLCKCGHSLDVAHNEHGCLLGCAVDVCAVNDGADTDPEAA